jgi:capsular polysaccharide biosynthesis protein
MTAPRKPDLEAEREVDLARWRGALVALWWIPVAGLLLGAVVGVLYSFRGGTNYKATALISLGQPTSPGGALVNGFGSNPRAVSLIVTSASTQEQAANRADMRPAALHGHVSVAQVGSVTGAGAARATPLISLTVTGTRPSTTAAAANALARIVVQQKTAPYVGVKLRTFGLTLANVNLQIASVKKRLNVIALAEKAAKNLDPLQQLVIISQEDNAETRLGNLIAQQETLQQQQAFAKEVESAKVITSATALKASAHSRNSSLLVGALIGLLLGAIVAVVADTRVARPSS